VWFIRKFCYSLLVLWGVASLVFTLFSVIPGDPALVVLGPRAGQAEIEQFHHQTGTDRPWIKQYLHYINDLSPISIHHATNPKHLLYLNTDVYTSFIPVVSVSHYKIILKAPYLRTSYISKTPVSSIIADSWPETALLAFSAILLATLLGIAIGIWFAVTTWHKLRSAVFVGIQIFGISTPSFFIALLFAWLLGYVWSSYTGLSPTGSLYEVDNLKGPVLAWHNLILPLITLSLRPMSIIVQITQSSFQDVLASDYIRTARALGFSNLRILTRYALKNALNPVVTAISGWLASLLAGAVFIERIFNWKGIGNEVVEALNNSDLPVVMGCTLFFAFLFVCINSAVDVIYRWLDPRIKINLL